jgi:hypothetical protein
MVLFPYLWASPCEKKKKKNKKQKTKILLEILKIEVFFFFFPTLVLTSKNKIQLMTTSLCHWLVLAILQV